MENPEGSSSRNGLREEIPWAEGAGKARFVESDEKAGGAGETGADIRPGKLSPAGVRGRISPGDVGCLILAAILSSVALAFFVKDIILRPTAGIAKGSKAFPTAEAQVAQPSIVIIGTAFNGDVYYFDSPNGVFYRDAVSGDSVAVSKFPGYEAFHWSTEWKWIAFVIQDRSDALPRLYVVDLVSSAADREPRLVTRRDTNGFPAEFGLRADSPVSWSGNEQYIAFVGYDDSGRAALFVTDVPTGTVRRLTEGSEPVTSVAWETYTNGEGGLDERIVYVLLRDGKEFTYSIEENGADNNPWER